MIKQTTTSSPKKEKKIYVDWGGHNVRLTWIPTTELPPSEKITSVHGYCFYNDLVLLVNIKSRGFNIPGGHIEMGESSEEAFHREVYEEGYVKGTATLLGLIEISHEENSQFDPNGKYPLVGYQAFFRMDVTSCEKFRRQHESTARIWVEVEEVPFVINDHALAQEVLKEALNKM